MCVCDEVHVYHLLNTLISFRYFVQKQWRIEYLKSDKATDVLGYIDISSLRKINIVRDPKYSFHLETEFRLYILQAESQADLEKIVYGLVQWRSHYLYENAADKKAFSESARPINASADAGVSPRPISTQVTERDREGDSVRSELVQMFSKAQVDRVPSPSGAISSTHSAPQKTVTSNLSSAIRREDQVVSPVRNLDRGGTADLPPTFDRKLSMPVAQDGSLPRQLSISNMDRNMIAAAAAAAAMPSSSRADESRNPFGEKLSTSSNPFGEKVTPSAGNPFGDRVTAMKSNPFVETPASNPFDDKPPPAASNPFGEKLSVPPPVNPFDGQRSPAPSAVTRPPVAEKLSGSIASDEAKDTRNWKADHDKLQRELALLRDKYAFLEKEANESKRQIATLSDAQRMQREAKVELDAALEAQNEERKKKRQLEEEIAALHTRFDIERRNWKEERHKAEEDAAAFRREKASLIADQRSLEEEISRLRDAVTQSERKISELKSSQSEKAASSTANPFGETPSPSPSPSPSSSSSSSLTDTDELKRLALELKVAQEQEKEERRLRREAELQKDDMKKQLDVEVAKREKEESRRKEEFLSLKAEMEKDRKKIQELRDELDQERRTRQLEEKKRAVNAGSSSRPEKREETESPMGRIESFAEMEQMMMEANLAPAQLDAVVQRMKLYLSRYFPDAEEFSDLEDHISSLTEELSISSTKLEDTKKELTRLLGEYGTRDKYISSLRSQLESQQKGRGGEGKGGESDVAKQVEKWREAAEAHEMQSSVLGKQIELLTAEKTAEIKAKDDTIAALRKELRAARKSLRELAENQMLQCGVTEADIHSLEEVKRELFFTLAIFIKQNLAESGTSCNVNLSDLFEEARDMDFHQWRHWIQSRLNSEAGHVPRAYSSTISGKGMETLAPESAKRVTEKRSAGGGASSRPVVEELGQPGVTATATLNRPKGKAKSKARTVEIK
jgi:hypothetical protein